MTQNPGLSRAKTGTPKMTDTKGALIALPSELQLGGSQPLYDGARTR